MFHKVNILHHCIGIALIFFALFSSAHAAEPKLYVKDGDSFVFGKKEIRLWGIDAPEVNQTCYQNGTKYSCGKQARTALLGMIDVSNLRCEEQPRAKHETRTVARCFVGERDLGRLMVRNGWAIDYEYFSGGFYQDTQAKAHEDKAGLWAGTFKTPREWRKANKF